MLAALTQVSPKKLQAFGLHVQGHSDRAIGRALGVDHKSVQRWYAEVRDVIRENSPMGTRKLPKNGTSGFTDAPKATTGGKA
jgi:transposase-like protein